MRKKWFGPKRFGIGVSPKSWEGWCVTALFLALSFGWAKYLHGTGPWLWMGQVMLLLLFGVVIFLTYARS